MRKEEVGNSNEVETKGLTRRWLVPGEVVVLANEAVFVEHVQLFACGELLPAHETGEALEVEHLGTRSTHQVRR